MQASEKIEYVKKKIRVEARALFEHGSALSGPGAVERNRLAAALGISLMFQG